MPSTMMSEAIAPVNLSPLCVVLLSSVCVMRTGIEVPADRVMSCRTGAGGGGGGGGCTCATGAGGCDCGGAGALRTTGAGCGGVYCGVAADGFFALSGRIGAGCAMVVVTPGCGGCTTRLSTTVRTPAIRAASPLASVRAASLMTVPFRVTTPSATEAWIGCPLRFGSADRLCCTCVFRLASSVAGVLLHPVTIIAKDNPRTTVRAPLIATMTFLSCGCFQCNHSTRSNLGR